LNVFLDVLVQNILPILLVASFGFFLRRRMRVDVGSLSTVVFNVLSPCLIFSSLATSQLPGDELLELVIFTTIVMLVMGALALVLARLLYLERAHAAAMLLPVMFVNSGNYGLTLLHLRYGDAGLSRGVVYYVTTSLMMYTVGVLIASLGQVSWREAPRRMSRLPAVYAAVLAIVVYNLGITLPAPVMRGITIAGTGAIPLMLLVLGMQIADLRPKDGDARVWPFVGLRLVVGPLVGLGIATLFGLQDVSRSAMIVQSAMPAAILNIIIVAEFGLPIASVARMVVFSTLLSPLTLAATITVLGL
jgi:predicted permease